MHRRLPLLLPLALLVAACSSPEDRAAKTRIFSPEDPPKVLLAAREALDPSQAAKDPKVLDRILAISAAEARERIGPHVQSTTVEFRWTRDGEVPRGADVVREVKLTEDRYVALGEGDDFHVRIENDEDQGMEWVKIGGTSYARARYARFRERRRDRGSSDHVVASAYATLEAFNELVHGGMVLSPDGEETFEGRKAIRYRVGLGPARSIESTKAELPPREFPEGGPDRDTALRLAALEEGQPSSVSGTLTLDRETAVPLAADLIATVVVPPKAPEEVAAPPQAPEGEGAEEAGAEAAGAEDDEAIALGEAPDPGRHGATLEFSVRFLVSGIDEDPGLRIPDHIEDAPRPPGVVATLRAYGLKGPKGQDDAAAEEAQEEEEEGEEDGDTLE